MSTLKKIKNSLQEGSFSNKVKHKCLKLVIKNGNTRNKLLQDMALRELQRDYGAKLKELVESYEAAPMEYSNKVWIFWRQGYENAPQLIKACYDSVKRNLTNRDIVFLSEENLHKYITLPDYIEENRGGGIPEAQYSDIIRITLLEKYGGLWLDSTVLCTGPDFARKLEKWPLFVYKMEDLDRSEEQALVCSNWMISCYTNVPYIRAVRDLIYEYWKKEKYLKNYYIFHLFMHMVKDIYSKEWKAIPVYNNISPHILAFEMLDQYSAERFSEIKRMSDFHKLNRHIVDEIPENMDVQGTYLDLISQEKIF